MRLAVRRAIAGPLPVACGISKRMAALASGFGHSSQCERKRSGPQAALRMRLGGANASG